MSYVIDQALAVTPPQCRPDLLCRYVDDLFLLFPNEGSLNRFFTKINSVQRNIVFTKELETNNCLHFLDVLIEKTSTGFYFYPQETHPYRSLLEMVEFCSVAQETKPCQLFTPPRL